MRPRHDPTPTRHAAPRRRSLVALVTACVVPARGHRAGRAAVRPSPRIRRSRLGSSAPRRGRSPTDPARHDRDVLRARLRPRRRDVAVRRPRPGPRRPGRGGDPRPLLPGHDARLDRRRPRRSGSACCPTGRRRRPRRCSIYGRLAAVDDRRHRGDVPGRRGPAADPDDDRRRRPARDDLAAAGHRRERRGAARRRRSRPASSSAARRPAACSSCTSKPTSYDRYRGVLRIIASTTTPTVKVVNELPLETYLRGVVPVEMPSSWPTEALKAQAIAVPLVRRSPAAPGVSYYDVTDDTSSQVYRGALGEKAATNAIIARDARASSCAAAAAHRQHAVPLDRRRRDREQRERLRRRRPARRSPAPSATCAARATARPTGRRTTRHRRTRRGRRRRTPWPQLSAWFAADARTDVGTLTALDLRDRGVSGPADQRDAHRQRRDEDGVGRRLPVGLQRRPPGGRPDDAQHALRDRADPLTTGYRGADDRATTALRLGRRRRPEPGPLDGRLPRRGMGHARSTTTSSCSSGSRSNRSRRACRGRRSCASARPSGPPSPASIRGWWPRSTTRDRARLMADAGIVRNGAKIDATVGNAAALLATGAAFGSFDRYLAVDRAADRRRACPRPRCPAASRPRRPCPTRCRRTSRRAASGSSARPSCMRSCRASGSSTTTSPAAFATAADPTDSQVAALEPPGRRTEHERDPHDGPGDEGERRRVGGVERVGPGQVGGTSGRDEHDERRLEPVDDAAPQAVAREQPAAHLGDRAETGRRRGRWPRRPARPPSSRSRRPRPRSRPPRSRAARSRAPGSG